MYEVLIDGEPHARGLSFSEATEVARSVKGSVKVTIRTHPLYRKRDRIPGAHATDE